MTPNHAITSWRRLWQPQDDHEPSTMFAPSDAGSHGHDATECSEDELGVSLLNKPVAVHWHVSKRASEQTCLAKTAAASPHSK